MEIKEITSRQNATVLWASSLKEKKYREKHGAFLIEGIKLVKEAFASHLPVTHVFVSAEKRDAVFKELSLQETLDGLSVPPEIVLLSEACFDKICNENAPQGVIAAIKYLDFFKRIDKINGVEISPNALFLSSVRDPGNLGAIVRSAVAFGIDTVILSADSADIYNPKTIRSAMGGLFKIKVTSVKNFESFVTAARECGRRIFAAELSASAVELNSVSFTESDVFVIGNEGHGIPSEISEKCTRSIYIPISEDTESLNAAVAASILIWEQSKTFGV